MKLIEWTERNFKDRPRILVDNDERSPYKSVNESKGPLDRINIRTEGGALVDLKERSSVVAALKAYKLFRAYSDRSDTEAQDAMVRIIKGEIGTCHT
ncbi:hypothetical protein KGO5_04321 [Sinorhizobium sp. KGO-5]|nr:hypothetical protein KGO5_04321 [Sinorhizobium sp. KGO-5]